MVSSISLFSNFGSNAGNQIVNNGLISMRANAGQNEELFSSVTIGGSGTIQVGPSYRFETSGAVGSGQKVVMESNNGQGSTLAIDFAVGFQAPIYDFTASDTLFVTTPQYSSYSSSFANGVTTITLNGPNSSVGSLNLIGNYTSNLSVASAVDRASGFEQTRLTTSLADSSGTNGIIGTYRFFDKNTGTHFFTADAGEKNNVVANVPTYVEETNDFGAIDPISQDPTAINVYRFFDTKFGTHFFTASLTERNSVQAARSDLTYEPGSTFLEHGAQEAGDLPVYRFFDTKFGTHFYTGDQTEFNGLTTAGSATYRSDLTYEGVGFYAPAGSFK